MPALFIDPNVVYLLLMAGLWLSVTAVYVPGTGAIEALALGGVLLALVGLGAQPTQWASVVIVVLGTLLFLTVPLFGKNWMPLAYIGLALQIVGSLLLYNGLIVSPVLVAAIAGAGLLYHHYALVPAMARQHAKPGLIDDMPIVGHSGFVRNPINPIGTVQVRGETWTARAETPLAVGTPIVVTRKEGLTLHVMPQADLYPQDSTGTPTTV